MWKIPQLFCCGISTKSEILMTRPTTPTTARLSPDHRPFIARPPPVRRPGRLPVHGPCGLGAPRCVIFALVSCCPAGEESESVVGGSARFGGVGGEGEA